MTSVTRSAIRAEYEDSTPGVWKYDSDRPCYYINNGDVTIAEIPISHYSREIADTKFIANAHQYIPALLDALEDAERYIEILHKVCTSHGIPFPVKEANV
jgi:hypothetical protein